MVGTSWHFSISPCSEFWLDWRDPSAMWFHLLTVLLVAAERPDANLELLQLGLALQPAASCLRFMHIPKTGGTSIDDANMHLHIPAFDSLMRETYQRIAEARNLTGVDLGDLYANSHESPAVYASFLLRNGDLYDMIPQNATDQCEDVHTPPSRVPWIAEYYSECETFCAVREPLERFWSAYRMRVAGMGVNPSCDVHVIEQEVFGLLEEAAARPYSWGCFWTPQVEFVYGTRHWATATHQYCTQILRQENLDKDFAQLMAEIGRPDVKLPAEELMSDWSGCDNVSTADLTPATRKAIYEFYKEDYAALGYATPKLT